MRLGFLASAIAGLVSRAIRRPLLVIIFYAAVVSGSAYYASNNLGINTDTADMIARDLPWRQDFIAFREQFPNRFRTIIVVIDGSQVAVDRAAADLVNALAQRPELFLDIYQPFGGEFLERNGLLYLPEDELQTLADNLIDAQPLLGRLAANPSGAGLLRTLEEFIEQDAAAAQQLAPLLEQIAALIADHRQGHPRNLDWGGLGRPDAPPPRQLVIVQPALDFSKPAPGKAAMETLQDLTAAFDDVTVRITGSVAMEHEELSSVVQGASLAGLLALLLVTVVLYVALRSLWLLLVSLLVLVSGLVITGAFAAAAVGHLNLISVAFAVLYIGLGIDFIIHTILRFRELRAEGQPVEAALPAAARGVGMSLVICAVTTAAGFYAFIPTPFEGVSELGLISGTGMFFSLAVSLTLLPALLRWVSPRLREMESAPPAQGSCRRLPPRGVIGAAVAIGMIALLALPQVRFDNDPLHLRDADSQSVQAFKALIDDERAAPSTLTVLAESATAAAALGERLEALPEVRRVVTAATLVPDGQDEKLFMLEDLALVMGPGFGTVTPARAEPAELFQSLQQLGDTLPKVNTEAADELASAIATFQSHVNSLSEAARNTALAALERGLMAEFAPAMARLGSALSAAPFGQESLPPTLLQRFVLADGRTLVEIHPAEDLTDNRAASDFIDAVWQVAPNATGRPVVNREGGATVVRSFQLAFGYALIVVAVLVWFFLGRIKDALLVLGPVLWVSLVTAAIAVVFDQPFNFANIIALPLLLGVGVDSGIHMVHRWRSEPPESRSLVQASTGRAVLFSGLTTVASFGNLAFSPHPGMASMGWILTVGMLATLVATLILLPALLERRAL